MPEQDGPTEFIHHSVLDLLSSQELSLQLYLFHMQLFEATNESELIFQVFFYLLNKINFFIGYG